MAGRLYTVDSYYFRPSAYSLFLIVCWIGFSSLCKLLYLVGQNFTVSDFAVGIHFSCSGQGILFNPVYHWAGSKCHGPVCCLESVGSIIPYLNPTISGQGFDDKHVEQCCDKVGWDPAVDRTRVTSDSVQFVSFVLLEMKASALSVQPAHLKTLWLWVK